MSWSHSGGAPTIRRTAPCNAGRYRYSLIGHLPLWRCAKGSLSACSSLLSLFLLPEVRQKLQNCYGWHGLYPLLTPRLNLRHMLKRFQTLTTEPITTPTTVGAVRRTDHDESGRGVNWRRRARPLISRRVFRESGRALALANLLTDIVYSRRR